MADETGATEENDSIRSKAQLLLLPALALVTIGAIAAGILAIVVLPAAKDASQSGIGANGFHAFVEDGTDLGIGKVVGKADVVTALGDKAQSVSDPDVSKVFNYNGDRGQTATYDFVRADGKKASLYIDVMMFPSSMTMDAAHIYTATLKANNPINGHDAYYMLAQTLGGQREYRLMVINGLRAYKFVIDQPVTNITINEVSALASLTRLAQKAVL